MSAKVEINADHAKPARGEYGPANPKAASVPADAPSRTRKGQNRIVRSIRVRNSSADGASTSNAELVVKT
jgi:hypothetical protein